MSNHSARERRLIHDRFGNPEFRINPPDGMRSLSEKAARAPGQFIDWLRRNGLEMTGDSSRGLWKGLSEAWQRDTEENEAKKIALLLPTAEFLQMAPKQAIRALDKAMEADQRKNFGAYMKLEKIAELTNHANWIKAIKDDNNFGRFEPDAFQNDQTVAALIREMSEAERKELYEQYVGRFISGRVQNLNPHLSLFGRPNDGRAQRSTAIQNNRGKITEVMLGMLGEKIDDPDLKPLAQEALRDHYNSRAAVPSRGLIADAENNLQAIGQRKFDPRPDAERTRVPDPNLPTKIADQLGSSLLKGALTQGVLDTNALGKLDKELGEQGLNENVRLNVARQRLQNLDLTTRAEIVSSAARELSPEARLVIYGLVAVGFFFSPNKFRYALVTVLGYMALRYGFGIEDPLQAGLDKIHDGVDYWKKKSKEKGARLGMNTEMPPEDEIAKMWKFMRKEDRERIEQEAEALAILNGRTMSELAGNMSPTRERARRWGLDVHKLFFRKSEGDIPLYFRRANGTGVQEAGDAMAYVFFNVARRKFPHDERVHLVNQAFRKMSPRESWHTVMARDQEVADAYNGLVFDGIEDARGMNVTLGSYVAGLVGVEYQEGDRSQDVAAVAAGSMASGSTPLRPSGSGSDPLRPPASGSDPLRPPASGSDPLRPSSSGSDPLRPPPSGTDPRRPRGSGSDPSRSPRGGTDPLRPGPGGSSPRRPRGGSGSDPMRPTAI